jgi:hypothetical protein
MSDDGELRLVRFDPSKARSARWMWRDSYGGYLLKGDLNFVTGNPSAGKSNLGAWILAALTEASLPGCHQRRPVNCALIATEDDFNEKWGPMVIANGGNMDRVFLVEHKEYGLIDLQRQLQPTMELFRRWRVKAVLIDAIQDHLGIADANHNQQVRKVLTPLQRALRGVDASAIAYAHPNKKGDTFEAMVNGARAFYAVPRIATYLGTDPQDEKRRVLVQRKNNAAADLAISKEFRIVGDHVRPNGRNVETSRVVGMRDCELTFDDLLAPSKRGPTSYVDDELLLLLSKGPCLYKEALEKIGCHRHTLDKAIVRVGARTKKYEYQGPSFIIPRGHTSGAREATSRA